MALARDLSDLPKAESAQVDGWAPDAEPRFAQVLVEQWHAWVSTVLGREVSSFNEVSSADLVAIRAWFESNPAGEVVAS